MWKPSETDSPSHKNKGSLLLCDAFKIDLWLKRSLVTLSFLSLSEAYIASMR